jgi:hypothetical protein
VLAWNAEGSYITNKLWRKSRYCCSILFGLARTMYVRCIYGIFGREITKHMVMYGVCIQFWPTLHFAAFECTPSKRTGPILLVLLSAPKLCKLNSIASHTLPEIDIHTRYQSAKIDIPKCKDGHVKCKDRHSQKLPCNFSFDRSDCISSQGLQTVW